jgi:glycosyltransferase involved in cell wall biosynthesis
MADGRLPARTLAIFHLAETSGPSRSLEAELRWLAGKGSLDVAVPGRGAVADTFGKFADVEVLGYEALTLPHDPLAAGRAVRRARREAAAFRELIRARRPELVVVASAMLPAALIAARRERVPAIVYAGELFPGPGAGGGPGGAGSVARAAGGWALAALTGALADAVLACSRTVAEQYRRARRAEVAVLYPPIPDLSGGDREGLRSELGIGPDELVLATIGNITENRGQDVLIVALPAIRAELPHARCMIVGDPHPRPRDLEFRGRLVALAEQLDVAEAVTLIGHREEVGDVLAAADVVVNPRRVGEAFGRVACEALVAGRPVVAMAEGAVPEVLRDGETALLVPPADPEATARAALRLLRDPELAARLVAEGRRDVRRRFSPERSVSEFSRVVRGVAAARAGAPR